MGLRLGSVGVFTFQGATAVTARAGAGGDPDLPNRSGRRFYIMIFI
jgi:hypothetical protein